MRSSNPGFTLTVRRSLFITFMFFAGVALLAESHLAQQPAQERPVWDVQLARNTQAKSALTIQNQCKRSHTFTIIEQQTPYIQLLGAPTVNVPGNSSYDLPVQFNTNGMNAGQYQGTVVVKCDTCGKEKGCTQDREILPVRLVVQDNGPQLTPGNSTQPQVPGPPKATPTGTPTTGTGGTQPSMDKTGGRLLTVNINGQEFDEKGKKTKDWKNLPIPDDWCKNQGCPELKSAPSGKIYCQLVDNCGGKGKECEKATCHMVYAIIKDGKPGAWQKTDAGFGLVPKEKDLPKDPKEKKEKIEFHAIQPDKNQVYGCACY